MAYTERIERNGRSYYYVTKSFRTGPRKWRKLREYAGERPPRGGEVGAAVARIEERAGKEGLLKAAGGFKFLGEDEAEKLQDLKDVFARWYGNLPADAREKHDGDFLVRFTYNSNAIEGNRLSLRETSMILNEDIIPAGSTPNDYNEAINSRDCLDFVRQYRGNLNGKFILRVHETLTKNTKCKVVGAYRDHDVRISGSEWAPVAHGKVKGEMDRLLRWYYYARKSLHPVELAALFHNMLVRIHSFSDGNGRTSRVLMNWILMRNGFPMFFIEAREKAAYYAAIEKGDAGDDGAFVHYLAGVLMAQHTFRPEAPASA